MEELTTSNVEQDPREEGSVISEEADPLIHGEGQQKEGRVQLGIATEEDAMQAAVRQMVMRSFLEHAKGFVKEKQQDPIQETDKRLSEKDRTDIRTAPHRRRRHT